MEGAGVSRGACWKRLKRFGWKVKAGGLGVLTGVYGTLAEEVCIGILFIRVRFD